MNIKTISFNTPDSDIFKKIVGVAKTGFFDGRSTTTYFEECRWFVERYECIMVFTRDIRVAGGKIPITNAVITCLSLFLEEGITRNWNISSINFLEITNGCYGVSLHIARKVKRLGYIIIGSFAMKIGSQYFHVVRSILHSLPKWVGNHFLNYIE